MIDTTKCYEILGVTKRSNFKDIKKAYRKLSLKYHPDRNSTKDPQKFKEIIEAYQYLRSQNKMRPKRSEVSGEAAHAQFWRYYDDKGEEFSFNHQKNYEEFIQNLRGQKNNPNQEKPISQKTTHLVLYVGLSLVAAWIIMSEIFR